jgi:ketosteroid isomerase-like protein
MASDGIDSAIERNHFAMSEIVKGNPEPCKVLFSHRDDVSLGNPFGPFARGWPQAVETFTAAAARYQEGEVIAFELIAKHVTDELACTVEVERYRAKVGGSDRLASISLRVTSVFRPEGGTWKLVHRHADPITTPQPTESVIQK